MSTTANLPPREKYDIPTVVTLWVFSFVALMLIITRLSWRYRRGQKFFADDYWMAFSIVPLFLRVAFIHLALVNFTTYIRDPNYRKMGMGEEEIRKRILGSRMILPGRVFYAGFLWCMKICILIWFGRVTAGEKCYGTAIRFTYAFVAMSFVAVVLSTFLECRPVQLYWQVYPDPGQCVKAQYQLITMGVVNISTDLCLMAIPLPLVYKTRLPLMRKIQLFLLFCVSTLIIIISIIRMPVIVGAGSLQKSRTLWASIEVMVGCFVANAPILNSFLHTIKNAHASRIGSRSTSRKHPYTANTDERKRVRMPVTGQNSFGSLTRHDGNESVHDMVWKDDFALGTRLTSMQTHGTPAPMAELESKVSWGKKDWTVEGKDLRVAGS